MKKKIFGAVVVVAIAVGAMMNVNLNKTSNKGDLALANVESLAQGEITLGTQSIKSTPVTCRVWATEPSTGQPCYIDMVLNKIDCPNGSGWCTPFTPC